VDGMIKRKRKFKTLILLYCLFGILPIINTSNSEPAFTIDPVFYIDILAPVSYQPSYYYPITMEEEWSKIGIGIDVFDHTGWAMIYPRTWDYPGYPIPPYNDGGYDVLFVGYRAYLNHDPTKLFHSECPPDDWNLYQYNNTAMDWAINNYTQTYDVNERLHYAKEIQQILYDDLPQITIVYPLNCIAHDTNFVGWSELLWHLTYQSMENWTIPGQTEFYYACPADFEDFHAYQYESRYDALWLNQIYTGLIERYESLNYNYGPRLATSWETVDGLNYTVNINPAAVWADGAPLNASDVDFSYRLQITPAFDSPDYKWWSKYLRNNSISILDEHTVHISFNQSYTFQENNLELVLIPKHIWKDIPFEDMEQQAIDWGVNDPTKLFGAGPYKLHNYSEIGEFIHLKRNENFNTWSGITPYFEDIYFEFYSNKEGALAALEVGDVDMVDAQFSVQLSDIPNGTGHTIVKDDAWYEIALNNKHPHFGTGESCPIAGPESARYVRKAMSHAVPREFIISDILEGFGEPGVTGFPSISIGFDESLEPYEYNLTLAREYMRLAGFDIPYPPTSITPSIKLGLGLPIICVLLSFAGITIYVGKKERSN
jgi:ABC-type transport system substrate-binding protein